MNKLIKYLCGCVDPHSVCTECGVHFEPAPANESRWGNLCAVHRKPVKARDLQKDKVIQWACANWESLVPSMEADEAKIRASAMTITQAPIAAMVQQQQLAMGNMAGSQWPYGGLGNIFGGR